MVSDLERSKEIDDLVQKIEPKFQKAFKVGLAYLQESVSLSEIERAIEIGDINQATNLINELIVATAFIEFNREINNAVQSGGRVASKWAFEEPVKVNRIVFDLSVTESNTARFIEDYKATKVRDITRSVQESLGSIALDGVNAGQNPKKVAREIRDSIGLTAKQAKYVRNYEKNLRDRSMGALDRALRDKRFDRSVLSSIINDKPLTEDQMQKMVSRYRQRWVNHRAETIARTEAIRLVNIGNQEFWEQAIRSGKVSEEKLRRKWITTRDGKVRDWHRPIPSMNKEGVGFREPFKTPEGPLMFPGDPSGSAQNVINCRCVTFTRVRS